MTGIFSRLASRLALLSVSALLLTGNAMANDDAGLDDQIRLNTSISITGRDVQLGDIFSGYLSRPEKVVAQAPRPGQRVVLSAEWLNTLARTYGLNWRAGSGYDRAIVHQPGQTVAPQDILAVVKADLVAKGMPANYSISPGAQVPSVTVAMSTVVDIGVREAFFDPHTRVFSAVVEIPPGVPNAQFISLRGDAFPVIAIPVLKESVPKNTPITAAMLTTLDLPESQMRPDTIVDPAVLIGKAPKVFVRAGVPVREHDVAQMTLVEIPVLNTEMNRDGAISEHQVAFATFNATDLPSDVHMVRQLQVPVASRDLKRGEILDDRHLAWITMNDNEITNHAITDADDLTGRITKHPIRAGALLRTYDVARPIAVERGKLVTILWSTSTMNLTAQGQAMETGGVGDVIRVTNTKSKTALTAEIIDSHTVRLTTQQTASR